MRRLTMLQTSRTKLTRRAALASLPALVAVALLAAPRPSRAQPQRLPVVATFSILADLVRNVGGDAVEVTSLVPPGGDAHVYSPTPADARKLSEAKVVFVNGLLLEGWMERLIASSGARAPVIVTTKGITPIELREGRKDAPLGPDPHAWQDIGNARVYVANIRDALAAADPARAATYQSNAANYLARLNALEGEVKAAIAGLPADRRRIITSHDAFGYFGKAYGFSFIAPQGVSTEAEASAKDVARIIRQIKTERIPAVFLENVTDPRLIKRIAAETGARIGGAIYSDALSDDKGPASTYIEMIRHNITQLTAALAN
ncbi:MAG: metal ABC transporter substrate-binding protein [Beijerinckiaceae bacterium]|nr:metal ABC transporter substrate-binding protein [Beijerinckiaceae bacterium]